MFRQISSTALMAAVAFATLAGASFAPKPAAALTTFLCFSTRDCKACRQLHPTCALALAVNPTGADPVVSARKVGPTALPAPKKEEVRK